MSEKSLNIAVVAGDGIGPEVIEQGLRVIEAAGVQLAVTPYELGGSRYLKDKTILEEETLQDWRSKKAIYLGAVGHPAVQPGLIERGLLLKMRFDLDLYINLRPFVTDSHDFVVVRENTEGTYAGEGGVLRKGTPHEVATQGSVNTRRGVERCIRFAYDQAMGRNKHLTLVHKTNVLGFSGDLWQRAFVEVGEQYPEVETAYNHVDAACIYFVEDPKRYDVVVTDNLFGDILTDLGGAVSGGVGLAASANLNPARTGPSMFEPVHGSAPDIAGKNLANPIAAILSGAMMLEFLGEDEPARQIRQACHECAEMQGSTSEIGDAVIAAL